MLLPGPQSLTILVVQHVGWPSLQLQVWVYKVYVMWDSCSSVLQAAPAALQQQMPCLQATNLSQDEYTRRVDAEEIKTLVGVDYNPNKLRHVSYKPQDVMNWVLQPWYQEMLSMNRLLVSALDIDCVHSAS